MRLLGLVLLALALQGCRGANQSYMPLAKNREWSYRVRLGLFTVVEPVKATHSVSMSGVSGWQLEGPMGPTRLAWKGSQLLASQLSGTDFEPPIPLLDVSVPDKAVQWKGMAARVGKPEAASAECRTTKTSAKISARDRDGLKSQLTLTIGKQEIETTTVFVPGIGIVSQDVVVDGRFGSAAEYLSGP